MSYTACLYVAERDSSTLVVEDHEQRKQTVATIHDIDYNQSTMQSHLEECFEKEKLSPFPPSSVPVKKRRLRYRDYCFCKGPESYDDMIECEDCSTWFHFKCVGLCSRSNTAN